VFNAGAARAKIEIQDSVELLDAMHAPTRTWTLYKVVHAEIENERFEVDDSLTTGPREESIKTMTLVVRNHMNFNINTRQRVKNLRTNELFEITAIRYDGKRTKCFIDVKGGESNG
jgi:head-tail adaptor